MCRWMTYSGDPVLAEELLFRPAHSIIDQSLHAQLGEYTTNGDGFGLGWYGDSKTPAVNREEHGPVPKGSWGVVRPGEDEIQPFRPLAART